MNHFFVQKVFHILLVGLVTRGKVLSLFAAECTVVALLHTNYLSAPSLSPSLKLHCIAMTAIFTQNDHFFKSDQID